MKQKSHMYMNEYVLAAPGMGKMRKHMYFLRFHVKVKNRFLTGMGVNNFAKVDRGTVQYSTARGEWNTAQCEARWIPAQLNLYLADCAIIKHCGTLYA